MLPEPSFIDRDPSQVTAELIETYEQMTGRTLQPAQVERVLIDLIAYRESLLRIAVQEAAKQNLLTYAVFPMLDYLGELVGVTRLPAAQARTTLRFTLVEPQGVDVAIPVGTRAVSKDGQQYFTTDTALTIPAGQTTGDVTAAAEAAGAAANGYLAGDVNTLVGPVAFVVGVTNTTLVTGGTDAESDDHLRTRIQEAPEQFSVAGSRGAYRFWAKSAHQDIIDVAVLSPSPGVVAVYPLLTSGAPSPEIIALVSTVLNSEKVRPLTDSVQVLSPVQQDYTIAANLVLYSWADEQSVLKLVNDALAGYAVSVASRLGVDVVTSQIIALINGVSGVYKTILLSPAADGATADNAWAFCTAITLTVTGYSNG